MLVGVGPWVHVVFAQLSSVYKHYTMEPYSINDGLENVENPGMAYSTQIKGVGIHHQKGNHS